MRSPFSPLLTLTAAFALHCSAPIASAAESAPAWRWLPAYAAKIAKYGNAHSRKVPLSHADRFVYDGRVVKYAWPYAEPSDGPPRVLDLPDGPIRGRIVYDEARERVFYTAACCSTGVMVLAHVSRPSAPIARSDLGSVITRRGIRLGDSIATVRALDGAAEIEPIDGYPDLRQISYKTGPPKGANPSCGQVQHFVFARRGLVYIQFVEGC